MTHPRTPTMAQTSGGSWASVTGNSYTDSDKNVMDIVLEKDSRGAYKVSESEVAHVLQKLGADLRPGVQVEAVQICPMGKNVIQVVLKKDISMDRFINKELFEVSNGVRISQIRKSGVSEVTLLIKGLHPNSSDSKVFDYLKCLGTVSQKKVTLDTYKSGPLIGLLNGKRKYQITLRSDIDIGPLHIIDGQKVNLSFPGQRRFCYR